MLFHVNLQDSVDRAMRYFNRKIANYPPLLIFLISCLSAGSAVAAPKNNPNLAIDSVADEILAQLASDDSIALMPLSAEEPKLQAICQVLTSLLASRLAHNTGDRFIGMDRLDWYRFSTDGGLLSPKQVKLASESLKFRWLITGHVEDLALLVNINLFLWDTQTGYLRYVADCQLSPSPSLFALSMPMSAAKLQPYHLKWRSLPDVDYFALAIDVADVDGDGFNELVIADEKRAKVLKWMGLNFWKHPDLPEIQYGDDETPILERTRRRMLAADRDGDDRDEIYIGHPPDRTWQVQWEADKQATIVERQPVYLAQDQERFVVGQTAPNELAYLGQATKCWVWREEKVRLKYPCPLPTDYHSIATRMINIDRDSGEIAVVHPTGHLQIYRIDDRTTRLVWQTPAIFGEGVAVGDLNGDGVPEIVGTVNDLPRLTSLEGPLDAADSVELVDQFILLQRKRNLYVEAWRSPTLEGQIVDMKIADADNDDRNELIICLRIRRGSQIQLYTATE